jgi:gamma-glutamyltranspeptidase
MGGEMPLLVKMKGQPVQVVSGVGTAPMKATPEFYRNRPLEPWETPDRKPVIPAQGILATTTPGMFDGVMLALEKYGTMSPRLQSNSPTPSPPPRSSPARSKTTSPCCAAGLRL